MTDQSDADRLAALLGSIPETLHPYYPLRPPNGRLPLYAGPLAITSSKGDQVVFGTVEVLWRPQPRLIWFSTGRVPHAVATGAVLDGEELKAVVPSPDSVPAPPAHPRRLSRGNQIAGVLTHADIGVDRPTKAVAFQLINFMDYHGERVRQGSRVWTGRLSLAGGGWRVTLDARPDLSDVSKRLESEGGHAVTHIGRLEKEDGSEFSRAAALETLDGLHWFLSLANGSHCGPFLPVGLDGADLPLWARWGIPSTEWWPPSGGWADRHHPKELVDLFPKVMEKWLDPYWRRVVYIGVGYYMDANVPRTVERAIGLGQVVLELLVNAVVLEGRLKTKKEVPYARDGVRALLENYGIQTAIPVELPDLTSAAHTEGWKDGPWAVTAIRNEIIHPKRGAIERDFKVKIDAWRLMSWYVEMVLLAFFGFRGQYGNRLKWPRWVGQVEKVPWA